MQKENFREIIKNNNLKAHYGLAINQSEYDH